MNHNYISVSGDLVEPENLTCSKAQEVVRYLQSQISPYSRLIECRKDGEDNVVVIEVDVEVGQRVKHDIKRRERIAITFYQNDDTMPEVVALRNDFPKVPHLNLRSREFPRSLCLFERPYAELKSRWTASFIIERIREWLALTAKDRLHAEDQPLEPLLIGYGPIIIPHDLFYRQQESITTADILYIKNLDDSIVYIVRKPEKNNSSTSLAITIKCPAQKHGLINASPHNIKELHEFILPTGYDLINKLRTLFKTWISDRQKLNSKVALIVYCPKTRSDNSKVESTDIWAFLAGKTVREIGVDLGIWELTKIEGGDGIERTTPGLLVLTNIQKAGQDANLWILNPLFTLSRTTAAYLNGIDNPQNHKILSIGAGALGSQVLINSVRAGYGNWISVDKDYLSPHNLARYGLNGTAIGYCKSDVVSEYAKTIIDEDDVAKAIIADIIDPKDREHELCEAYAAADIILDMSAALSVGKHIAFEAQSDARRISMFLNPSGTDLVILAEDAVRKIRLDHLESQYYREISEREEFSQHLAIDNKYARYGRSCGDFSSTIPHDFVSLHSAIASRMLRSIAKKPEAFVGIWKIDSQNMSVTSHQIEADLPVIPNISNIYRAEDWIIYTYPKLLTRIYALREAKLPCETGGILIGSYDFQRKIIYAVDTVPSPADSVEKLSSYIRGSSGLKDKIVAIGKKTAGMLEYIGEWHSHPDDYNPSPSECDRRLFEHMRSEMQINCLPTLMLIAGSEEKLCWLLNAC